MNPIKSIVDLKKSYQKLPGVGEKTAERLAYATLRFSKNDILAFIDSLNEIKDKVHRCPTCGIDIDTADCPICDDSSRNKKTIIIVSEAKNIQSFEKTDSYHGSYFVLGGSISPLKNVSPSDIHIEDLLKRIEEDQVEEVILALNSTIDGETTSLYIANILKNKNVTVSRLAFGLPIGADLEYVDELTIRHSLEGRVNINEAN